MADPFTAEQLIQMAVSEHVAPGQEAHLDFEVPREMTAAEVQAFADHLRSGGVDAKVAFGSTPQWPNAVRVSFVRPGGKIAPKFWPLIALALGALGITGFGILGWRLTTTIQQNLFPLALLAAGTTVLVALALSGKSTAVNTDLRAGKWR